MKTPVKARQSAMATSKKASRSGELAICSPSRSARHPSVPLVVLLFWLLLLLLLLGRPCFPGNIATPQREQARQRPARQRRAPRQPYASNQKLARGAITKVPTPLKIIIGGDYKGADAFENHDIHDDAFSTCSTEDNTSGKRSTSNKMPENGIPHQFSRSLPSTD